MIYGLYLSATGVMTNSYGQDVIANNIANSETVGFKKDLLTFQQRSTAAQELGHGNETNPLLENIGGGLVVARSTVDARPGDFEPTSNNMDIALDGSGFLAVNDGSATHLTRNGELVLDRSGTLSLATDPKQAVLDDKQAPIVLDSTQPVAIAADGTISQNGKIKARLGLFSAGDPSQLHKVGGTLWAIPDGTALAQASPIVRPGFIEQSNVDPATELTNLIEVQRELEANANMINIQDQTLDKLVNDVGKIS